MRPDGKDQVWLTSERGEGGPEPYGGFLSPDGKRFVYGALGPLAPPSEGDRQMELFVRGVDEEGRGTSLGVEANMWLWSAEGRHIAYVGNWQ